MCVCVVHSQWIYKPNLRNYYDFIIIKVETFMDVLGYLALDVCV